MEGAAVLRYLRPFVHAVIADHAGNADPVIVKNLGAAFRLAPAVFGYIAPGRNGGLIAKKRHRQDLALLGQALEPFDRDEAIIEIALAGTVPHDIIIQPDEET
jgi:hypothetical protein